ncbi:MAG: malto-oligosyltrehalose synthase [Thermomicrobiales bacterium]
MAPEAEYDHEMAAPRVPTSTYRVQLNAGFTFQDARAIVPYLASLGIGALYTSPFLKAATGSTHGYDVTDYGTLNPEIGGEDDFAALVATLQEHGLGLIADIVPNHMGIAGGANPWWQDVLENGRSSPYAPYFDIDWRPLKEELRGKMLLPVLGDHYGVVLERGELRLEYSDGAFRVAYFDTPFPIAPPTYPLILAPALEHILPSPVGTGEGTGVRADIPDDDPAVLEFQSIITAFARLPPQDERDPERLLERRREGIVAKRRLADLVAATPVLAAALAQTIAAINGHPGDPRSFDALDTLLDAQSYRLSSFRTAGEEINYRRFFAINELAAVRQEEPEVFAASHALILRLIAAGAVTGLRIDHPDGLWDPAGYFAILQRAAADALAENAADDSGIAHSGSLPFYVVAEKILEPGEVLPDDWAIQGTVGYEFARIATGLFVDGANQKAFNDIALRFTGERRPFATIAYEAKDLILRTALASEANVLTRALNEISEQNRRTRDFTLNALRHAVREVIAGFPVYRTYVACAEARSRGGEEARRQERQAPRGDVERVRDVEVHRRLDALLLDSSPARLLDSSTPDRRAIERAVATARRRNPASDPSVFAFLAGVLLQRNEEDLSDAERAERCRFVMKFQQLTGPVMAKGVEDTAFYIDNRLLALNEVGGDPGRFGVSVAEFHQENLARQRRWPDNLLTSSTHDTKRSEDVRARITVLSEFPHEWRAGVARWSRLNRKHRSRIDGEPAPDRNDEYRFYQTLIGAWPWNGEDPDEQFITRIEAFMLKAAREAQMHTSWVNPDEAYENAVRQFVRGALDPGQQRAFLDDIATMRAVVAHIGIFNALSQQLLKLTVPGVPDLYQGTELWHQRLVDPDNREPVDYAAHARLLATLDVTSPDEEFARDLLASAPDGRIKLFLTARALHYRAAHPGLFRHGDYTPVNTAGAAAEHVVAFTRGHSGQEIVVAVPRLVGGLIGAQPIVPLGPSIWEDTALPFSDVAPGTRYRNIFTGETIETRSINGVASLPVADVFATLPFALLEPVLPYG